MTLPNDVARCAGVGNDEEGWRDGCEDCAHRLAGSTGDGTELITPPPIIVFECEFWLEAKKTGPHFLGPNAQVTGAAPTNGERSDDL